MSETPSHPIKVVNVIARLNIGGPAIYVSLITQRLNPPHDAAYESTLIAGKVGEGEGDMGYYALEHGVEPVILPALGRELNPLRDLKTIWSLYRLFRQIKPDVVSTHTAKAGFVGRIAARLAGVPVVVHTFHGHVFHGYFSPTKTRLFKLIEQFCARLSDTIIVLTASQRDELADQYHIAPRDKFTVMGGGLELDSFAAAPRLSGNFREQWHIPQDAKLVTIVGRLVPVKNHALFLDAAAKIHAVDSRVRFAIVGDGDLRAALESQVDQLGLREVVTFTGWQQDVLEVYAGSDMLVISSVNEGTPFTVIEALAAGVPIVATAVGGLPDLLEGGKFGALVPSENADALAAAVLNTLKQPPDTASLRAEIVAKYGIDRLIHDLDGLYRSLLAKKG